MNVVDNELFSNLCNICYSTESCIEDDPLVYDKEQLRFFHERCKKIEEIKKINLEFVASAREGNLNRVTDLLQLSLTAPYHEAVSEAAKTGKDHVVRYLLLQGNISNHRCGLAAIDAAKNNHFLVIKELVRCRRLFFEHIPKGDLDVVLNIAEQNNFREIIEFLKPIKLFY